MSTYTCAVCGQHVYLDDDHVKVAVQHRRIDDRDDRDDYLLHVECARTTFDGWRVPA